MGSRESQASKVKRIDAQLAAGYAASLRRKPARLTKKQQAENEARAQRARNVMDAYGLEVGKDESNLRDLLADMLHREAENFEDALRSAQRHFQAESEGSN